MQALPSIKPIILSTFAVAEEIIQIKIPKFQVVNIVTGVGKAQAAHVLTKSIAEWQPCCVLNIGTAGTQRWKVGDICLSRHYIDRDFQRIPLPGLSFEITDRNILPPMLNSWIDLLKREVTLNNATVNTGDDFVTGGELLTGDVIDMEGYAQALVCREMGVPILSVKYITDVVGENSVEIWEKKLAHAREALTLLFESINKSVDSE